MLDRPDILLLEGTEETIALGTGSALGALAIPYQDARVEYHPQLNAKEGAEGTYLQTLVLRMPRVRLADLAAVHRSIDGITATLSSWRYAQMTGPANTEGEWGWHRVGPGTAAERLYSLNHGDGIGWLLGSRRQLTRACLLNEAAGRGVEQKVFSPTGEISSLALTEEDLCALELDLCRDGEEVTSWGWRPSEENDEFRAP